MGGKTSTPRDSQKICQSPQHITHNISSAVSKLPERLRLCSPVTKQLTRHQIGVLDPNLKQPVSTRSSKAQEGLLKSPSFSWGLKASIQKGRMAERSIKLVRPRVSLVQMHCYFAPKKNSQKWSYSQIHDPLQGSKHFWTKNPHLKEFLKHFYWDLFVSFMDQGWAPAPKICFMVVFTHPSSLGSSVIRNMTR